VRRRRGNPETYAELPNRRGTLLASGLIVGESLVGVLMAAVIGASGQEAPLALAGKDFASVANWLGLAVFATVAILFYRRVVTAKQA